MKITLDDRPLESDVTTLGEALLAAQNACEERLVVQAEADGAPVPADDLMNPPATSPYAEEINFTTADPSDLVQQTLTSASTIIDGLRPRQKQVADLFMEGDIEPAKEQLMSLLSGWLDVNKTVQLCTSTGRLGVDSLERLDPSLEESVKRLAADLQELRGALETGDYTAVADLLAYEMDEQADRWDGIVTTLADSVG